MDIYICTHGRATEVQQHTLKSLRGCEYTPKIVIQRSEIFKWSWYKGPMVILPPEISTIAATRDYLVWAVDDTGNDYMVMLDDDLHFAVRRENSPTLFRQPDPEDITEMLSSIDQALADFPMVGIGPREGGNRNVEPVLINTRIMRVIGIDRGYFKRNFILCGNQELMEDFHLNLQVLRSGADTCVLNSWVSNQAGGSNAPGGCSLTRTAAAQDAAARALAAKHPGFVTVVQKVTKGAWGGGTRTDVKIQWKKARASAL